MRRKPVSELVTRIFAFVIIAPLGSVTVPATWPIPASSAHYSPTTYPGWAAGYPVAK